MAARYGIFCFASQKRSLLSSNSIVVEVSPQANAERQFTQFQVEREIEVEGVAPPVFVRLIVLAYLTGIILIGLLIGLRWQNHRRQRGRLERINA
ncbi:hypothetical protein BCD64_00635 [Nostoc sp. MBR 210]|nr:hypothetical protein BCD64_00635 [Nostoc sp. MBR 210]